MDRFGSGLTQLTQLAWGGGRGGPMSTGARRTFREGGAGYGETSARGGEGKLWARVGWIEGNGGEERDGGGDEGEGEEQGARKKGERRGSFLRRVTGRE
ncbi:hypothetical protein LTS18_003674 [Coniosporium uncinatum]|uniref:Uncharacterized protein n=1 Tax=Coniosporium uncinatum TaxID=93489 RepID=A0ACC3DBF8_9PEZI|nr:hypothetical protein LTS18_003674 [Coniosporium uncinatum]